MSFFTYFKSFANVSRQKNFDVAWFIAFYLTMMIGGIGVALSFNGVAMAVDAFATFLFLFCVSIGISLNNTPNLAAMMPLSHKKKTLYNFLAPFWMMFLVIVFAVAFLLVVGILSAIIVLLVESGGTSGDVAAAEEEATVSYSMGVYGGIFSFLYVVILYSCGMISSFLKKRKHATILLYSVCGGLVLTFLLMSLPYRFHGGVGFCSPFVSVCYESMTLPWLCIAIWCLIAAGALGTAIYLGINRNKPSKY